MQQTPPHERIPVVVAQADEALKLIRQKFLIGGASATEGYPVPANFAEMRIVLRRLLCYLDSFGPSRLPDFDERFGAVIGDAIWHPALMEHIDRLYRGAVRAYQAVMRESESIPEEAVNAMQSATNALRDDHTGIDAGSENGPNGHMTRRVNVSADTADYRVDPDPVSLPAKPERRLSPLQRMIMLVSALQEHHDSRNGMVYEPLTVKQMKERSGLSRHQISRTLCESLYKDGRYRGYHGYRAACRGGYILDHLEKFRRQIESEQSPCASR